MLHESSYPKNFRRKNNTTSNKIWIWKWFFKIGISIVYGCLQIQSWYIHVETKAIPYYFILSFQNDTFTSFNRRFSMLVFNRTGNTSRRWLSLIWVPSLIEMNQMIILNLWIIEKIVKTIINESLIYL